ncbi:MAG: sulfatase-like hydrolase/transferase, partial [Gemmatimonadetes bacterium]|nr:sulfatase-like hydrolase/transferase [Gemmatimonadota bacterium]
MRAIEALCALLLATVGTNVPAAAQSRPSVIFLLSDDHAAHAISAYRALLPYAIDLPATPNLDRLASSGMLFRNAFVTNSICAPSRAAILTGQYGHLNGVMTNREALHSTAVTFPQVLREAGYETALFGKWHLRTAPTGFERYEVMEGQGSYYNPVLLSATDTTRHTGYTNEILTERALAWLDARRGSQRPFLLMLNFNAPHRPWEPGPAQLGLYRDTVIAEPPTFWDDGGGRASPARTQELTVALDLFDRDLKLVPPPNLTPG